jgi:hypothetical protein
VTRRHGRCPACGCMGPLDHEHVAREANDADYTVDICVPDHKLKTNRDDTAGNMPGIDPSGARILGTLQHLIIMAQRHGTDSIAQIYRQQSHQSTELLGREGVAWGRRNLVADPVTDTDVLVMIQHTARITAAMWGRLLTDPRLSVRGQMFLLTTVEFYGLIAEHPLDFTRYATAAGPSSLPDTGFEYTQHTYPKGLKEEYFINQATGCLERNFTAQAAGFIRHAHKLGLTSRQVIPAPADTGSRLVCAAPFAGKVASP